MKNTRRNFIKTFTVGIGGLGLFLNAPFKALSQEESYSDGFEIQKGFKVFNKETQKVMEKLADLLVPGSKEIGIKKKLMEYIINNKQISAPLDAGLWNINSLSISKYKKPFYELENKDDIKKLTTYASKNAVFFTVFMRIVLRLYYTDPHVWNQLSYNGPPQPSGFLDYTTKPT